MIDNSDCYWYGFDVDEGGGYHLCYFDPEETAQCEVDKPCMRYVTGDLVDDYLRHLISYNNFLEKCLALWEEREKEHSKFLDDMERILGVEKEE